MRNASATGSSSSPAARCAARAVSWSCGPGPASVSEDSRRCSLPSPDSSTPRKAFAILLRKEWRDLLAGRAFWALLLLLSPLVGYSYVQALALYAEASRSAADLPEVARNLSPLDGVFVPTFGGLYLASTFLFPFV